MTVQRIEAHGTKVWADVEMDHLRRHRCLCLTCGLLHHCPTSQSLFQLCLSNTIALAVTRCPRHLPRPGTPK